jgi:hypothetical protein
MHRWGAGMLALLAVLMTAAVSDARARRPVFRLPVTHGGDPASLNLLPEMPPPLGGPLGHRLSARQAGSSDPVAGLVQGALPSLWCGEDRSTNDSTHEVANGGYSYHAIYAYPADGSSRMLTLASTLQTDAFQASSLLEFLYERAIRFDMGTNCGSQYLDITALRLPQTTAQLQAAASSGPDAVLAEVEKSITAAGFHVLGPKDSSATAAGLNRNYLVWLDGAAPGGGVCGIGTIYADAARSQSNWNNYGGKVALVFRNGNGFCASNIVRHEIGHNLGALQAGAPHAFDGAHCDDAYEDTMCYPESPSVSGGQYESLYFDYGNDDYWDPPGASLPRWTVNLNRFICADAACNTPGGSAYRRPLDRDRDLVPDALDNCPDLANTDQADDNGNGRGNACEAPPSIRSTDAKPRTPNNKVSISSRTRRVGKGRWRLSLKLRGIRQRLRLSVTCRRAKRTRTVYRRTVTVPRSLAVTLRCDTRPRVALNRG